MADEMDVPDQDVQREISDHLSAKIREMNVSSESESGAAQPGLLFHLTARPEQHKPLHKLKFYYCAIQERPLLLSFLRQAEERSITFPEVMKHHRESMIHQCCMKAIGDKTLFWIGFPGRTLTCIMSTGNNSFGWAFRSLDTSTICRKSQPESSTQLGQEGSPRKIERSNEIEDERLTEIETDQSLTESEDDGISSGMEIEDDEISTDNSSSEIMDNQSRTPYIKEAMTAIVGNRLVLLLYGGFPGQSWWTTRMFSLDGNSETWSVLPDCPDDINKYCMPVSWGGKLYIYNLNALSQRNVDALVLVHFDFESNKWLDKFSSPVNSSFARRLMELPRSCLASAVTSFLISSRSGTLYAIFGDAQLYDDYSSIPVYAMDDLKSGWIEVSTGKLNIGHSQQHNRFPLPTRACQMCGSHYDGFHLTQFWEIGEHDILLLIVQFHPICCMDRLRYSWWVFNKDEGFKSYSSGEFPVPLSVRSPSDIDLLVAKIE